MQVQLLHRTSRAFELTPQGDILLGYAKRLLALNGEMVERLTESDLSGRLRIGVAEYLAPLTLHRILHRFRSHYPQIRLEVVIGLGQNLAPEFERGDLDLAVAGAINKDGESLFEEEMNWVSGPNWFPGKDDVVKLITLPLPPGRNQQPGELAGEHSFIPLHGRTAEVIQTDERNILALEPDLR